MSGPIGRHEGDDTRVDGAPSVEQLTALVAAIVRATLLQLDEMRLPLHILLESRFGELNDNQEELLAAARDAGDALDGALRRLATVTAPRDTLPSHHSLVQLNDVVRAVEPQIHALAERHQRSIVIDLEPGLPRAWADRAALAEALVELLRVALDASEGGVVHVRTTRGATIAGGKSMVAAVIVDPFPSVRKAHEGGASAQSDARVIRESLAMRLLDAHGARITRPARALRVDFGGA